AIAKEHRQGRGLYVNNKDLSPVSTSTLLCIAVHSRAIIKHKQTN
ncbi:unnamed protein product, partial [Staurois parvus]